MSSFVSRSIVLVTARLMNMALLMLSPILLVRLLEIAEYGRYRQFTVTALFITSLANFAVASNLNYLIARSPERTAVNITNACLLMFAAAAIGAIAVIGGGRWIVPVEIYDYRVLLALYIVLFLNLDVLVSYWLAHGRSDRVMVYSVGLTVLRLTSSIGAAMVFHDVAMIFASMVIAEAIKGLAVYCWLRYRGLLVYTWDGLALREQLRLVVPLGSGSALYHLNENLGKLIVGTRMGAAPTAIYTTAAYQIPLVGIVQSALADVVFPDMVRRSKRDPIEGLKLWKRVNVLFFAVICPAWLLLTYFAEPLIRLMFTEVYVSATPYFQVFLLLMVRQCFQFSTPLRSVADNASFARANIVALAANVAFILALMPKYGLWGPTLGVVIGQLWVPVYLGRKVMERYRIGVGEVCDWGKLGLTLAASVLGMAALHASLTMWGHSPASTIGALGVFAAVYLLLIRIFLREEYGYVVREVRYKVLRARP